MVSEARHKGGLGLKLMERRVTEFVIKHSTLKREFGINPKEPLTQVLKSFLLMRKDT